MNDLYEKLDAIKDNLNDLEVFKKLDISLNKVKNNKELMDKINKYNESKDEKLRLDIYNYDEIKEYKKLENEINMIILSINQKLRIINKRSCFHENH